MTKILLVEDDKSLREIYGVRLQAEGYTIVSAGDGEEALAAAIKERPDLVISDVMMPKVSGFDMLDILRSTTETKNIKVIVMTALSSEEQRQRGEQLGADRYLVKSQVGIEDVVRVVHDVLEDTQTSAPQPVTNLGAVPPQVPAPLPVPPIVPIPQPVATAPLQPQPMPPQAQPPMPSPIPQPMATPMMPPQPAAVPAPQPISITPPAAAVPPSIPGPVMPVAPPAAPSPQVAMPQAAPPSAPVNSLSQTPQPVRARVIQPLGDPTKPNFNIDELLDKEIAKEAGIPDNQRPTVMSLADERQELQEQLSALESTPEPTTTSPVEPIPPQPPTTPEQASQSVSSLIDTTAPSTQTMPTEPLQNHSQTVIPQIPQSPSTPADALSGTTLPPTSL